MLTMGEKNYPLKGVANSNDFTEWSAGSARPLRAM